jgi:ubiquinone/menaquinone biosynthesis C-methylase UbiE
MKMTDDEIYRTRKEFFNDHAENWRDMWYKDSASGRYDKRVKDIERLFSLVPLKRGDRVLDVGCGSGVLARPILERIGPSGILHELDFAEKMIEINQNLHKANNIRFIVSDAEKAPLDDASCDAIICFSCYPHLHDKEEAMTNFVRILKPGGLLAVSHFDSSEAINRHHISCRAVMHDHLPVEEAMRTSLETAGLRISLFFDEPGFYCIIARK